MLFKFGERGTLTGWNNQGRLPESVHMNCSLMQQTFYQPLIKCQAPRTQQ